MNHAQQWSTRIIHEASLHEANSFLTLTYEDNKLPSDQGLSKREFQLFMKRLRRALEPSTVRFFGCGEYGGETKRPHYHLIVFGEDFARDRYVWAKNKHGQLLYRSPFAEVIWDLGYVWIGAVTPESAGYVARYALKKAQSYHSEDYTRIDAETGEVVSVEPEFLLMSRRPGIGSGWWDKFQSDAFPSDFVIIGGRKVPVPAYYRKKLAGSSDGLVPATLDIDRKRAAYAARHSRDNTTERRLVKDELAHLRARQLGREDH